MATTRRPTTPPTTPPAAAGAPAPATTPPKPAAPAATPAPPTATPPAVPTVPRVAATDPVELQLYKSQLPGTPGVVPPNGTWNLFARVLNIADKGLKNRQIVFTLEGRQETAVTNSQGDASFPTPLTAPADGSELRVSAHISGIRNFSVMHIIQRIPKTPRQIARDLKNNRRARKFMVATAGLWLICLLVALFFGLGNPLISNAQTSLTGQQEFYNNLPGVKGSGQEIHPDSIWWNLLGTWQKPFFGMVLLWTIFSLIYWILAVREEVMEIIRQGIAKIADRRYASASARDSLLERLMAFSGHLTSVRKPTAGDTAATTTATGKPTFWELFRSDIISDVLVEIGPKALAAILGR